MAETDQTDEADKIAELIREYREHQSVLTPYKTCRGCGTRSCARGAKAKQALLALGVDPGHPDRR